MFASIDIGTNTIRCMIANTKQEVLTPLFVDMKIIRLGEDFKNTGIIGDGPVKRAINELRSYLKIINSYGISARDVVATGTSVMRDAPNGQLVARKIFEEVGININIISGDKEADITLSGISMCFGKLSGFYATDIGGGSTEYMCCKNGSALWKRSLNMGVVHLTEEYIHSDPVSHYDLLAMESAIDNNLNLLKNEIMKAGISLKPLKLIGTAGTVTTLAMIDNRIGNYDRLKIHGHLLKKENINNIYKRFIKLKIKDRLNITGVEKGREDLVLCGTAICIKSMEFFDVDSITVSECGLLEGLIGQSGIF
jgi:exopolyphosphatase/guanosine-5'-triphosphate,3'-diphosphate pyrophosphatase